jgi:hypothetical protein
MSKRKKKPKVPKPRHAWQINPKSRVTPSEKTYKRSEEKKKEKNWSDDIHWFG